MNDVIGKDASLQSADKEPAPNLDARVKAFVAALDALDVGERARLKRCAGKTLAESRNVLTLFYRLLPKEIPAQHEEIYFLVATLYPLAENCESGDLGVSLRKARQAALNDKGLDRRVEVLLDADRWQLPFRLRQTVHFLQSKRVPVCWPVLLEDLLAWNYSNRPVQRRWARSYFGSH